jgi:hypothetical protein
MTPTSSKQVIEAQSQKSNPFIEKIEKDKAQTLNSSTSSRKQSSQKPANNTYYNTKKAATLTKVPSKSSGVRQNVASKNSVLNAKQSAKDK